MTLTEIIHGSENVCTKPNVCYYNFRSQLKSTVFFFKTVNSIIRINSFFEGTVIFKYG